MRRIAESLLQLHLFIALCAVLLCMATGVMLPADWPVPVSVYTLVGGATLAAYNYHAVVQQRGGMSPLLPAWMRRAQSGLILFGVVLTGYSLMRLPVLVWLLSAVLALLTMLYSTPVFSIGRKQRLKDFGGIKVWVLSVVWVAATTLLPAAATGLPLSDTWVMLREELLVRMLLLLPLCFAFNLRDIAGDAAAGVRTVAVRIGLARGERVAAILFTVFAAANTIVFFHFPPFAITGVAVAVYGWLATRAAVRGPGSAVAYLFWVDGALALYALTRIIVAWQ